ncbi:MULTISPECIES: glycosyltransferase family 2 protein [Cyanophyceae]|uniref:Glycosyltransferase n=1 Tax=Leptolyngbya subtilissima DQ-A4 TaxID=2933933 RepID=A0ABV0K128_9CYAN|nr:glycosyltransferase family 2 protein [Nodosilinea sp. FACHB-141]
MLPSQSQSKPDDIKQLQNQLQEKEATIIHLQQALASVQLSRSALTHETRTLQQELAYLSTTKASIRKLFKATLQRIKAYDLVYRNYKIFVPLYNFFFRDQWRPATLTSALQDASLGQESPPDTQSNAQPTLQKLTFPSKGIGSNIDTETLLVRTTVVARALGIKINGESDLPKLEYLSALIAKTQHALCIKPNQQILPLLQAITQAGGQVTCFDCSFPEIANFANYNIRAIADTLESWLVNSYTYTLKNCDLLCLSSDTSSNSLLFLKGHLTSQTRIITFPAMINSEFDWVPGEKLPSTLNFYEAPAESWIDPFANQALNKNYAWPWNYPTAQIPEGLPSGYKFPKISIITVTFNQGAFLEETIRSVLMQGYPNLEYIVIDGGSTDNTPVILDRYRHELTYCVSEPDQGQANALNKGFSHATGDILAWLNSDDYYLPGTLMRVAQAFKIYESDIVTGGCRLYHDYNPELSTIHHDQMPIGQVVPLSLEKLLDIDNCWLKGYFFYQPEVFWTRDIWERSGARLKEDLFYSMDYEMWLRMARAGAKVIHIPDVLVNYRVHKAQKTYGEVLPYLPELREVSKQFSQHL